MDTTPFHGTLLSFSFQPSVFLRIPLLGGVDINLVFAVDLRPLTVFVNQIEKIGDAESISKLPQQFAQFWTNQNGGMLLQFGYSKGIEADIGATVAGLVTTDTMEDLAGVDTLADGWNVHATDCIKLCAGGIIADDYDTENQYDTLGIAIGFGIGGEVGTDVITTTDWIAWGKLNKKGCLQIPFLHKINPKLSTGACPY